MTPDEDFPLVSGRSPSNARAQEERKHPSPTADPAEIARLGEAFEREENARRVWARAAGRLRDPDKVKRAEAAAGEHAARAGELAAQIEALGGAPPAGREVRQLLDVSEADIDKAGDDAAIEALLAKI